MFDRTMNSFAASKPWGLACGRVAALLALSLASFAWAAPGVTYVATDIADTNLGEDLWSYDYLITGPLDSFQSVNLLFASDAYAGISVKSFAPDLSPTVTDPVPGLGADGQVNVTMLANLPTDSTAGLSVQFVWTGGGVPAAQAFELLDDQFNVMTTGVTSAVPEVSTAALLLGGLMLLPAVLGHRKRHTA